MIHCFACAGVALALLTSCGSDDCNCGGQSALPPKVDGYVLTELDRYDEEGNSAPLLIDPRGATLRTTGKEVHISYTLDGVDYDVVYEVVPAE